MIAMAVTTEEDALERLALLASMAGRLRKVPGLTVEEVIQVIRTAAEAGTPRALERAKAAVEIFCEGGAVRKGSQSLLTFAQVADQWTSGELHQLYPDRVGAKDNERDKGILRKHVNPRLGAKRITEVTLEDLDVVMSKLPSELAPPPRSAGDAASDAARRVPAEAPKGQPSTQGILAEQGQSKGEGLLLPKPRREARLVRRADGRRRDRHPTRAAPGVGSSHS